MASVPPIPQPQSSRTVSALTPEAKLWPAQSPLLERLMQLLYGNEGLDYMAKKQLAEGPRESAPFSMSAELPGANPEAPTPGDAMVGLAMSGGGLPGGVSRAFAPQIERASARKPPADLDVRSPHLKSTLDDVMSSKRFVYDFKEKKGSHLGSEYELRLRPRKPSRRLEVMPESYPGDTRRRKYDPEIAEIADPGTLQWRIQPKKGWASGVDELVKDPNGLLFRGMSAEEFEAAKQSGIIKGKGEYNLGDAQKGLTFYSTNPGQADSYAAGFAPWQKKPSHTRPGYVVAIRDPQREGTQVINTERGVPGEVPVSSVVSVYEGRPYTFPAGGLDLVRDYGSVGHIEGSRYAPSPSVAWKQLENPFANQPKPSIASPDLIAALMEATKAVPEAAPARRPSLTNNASAESGSGASAEALSRTSGMATRGQKFVIRDRAGNFRPATEDGAMSLRPGESFGIMGPYGFDVHDSK